MQGKIIKGIGGFYYIHVEHRGIYECKAKGVFRNRKVKPLVGDNVEIDVISETDKKGNIRDILPCLLYTSPSPRDLSTSRMPSSA